MSALLILAGMLASPPAVMPAPVAIAVAAPDATRMELARRLVEAMDTSGAVRSLQLRMVADGGATFDKMVPAPLAARLQLANPKGYAKARDPGVTLLQKMNAEIMDQSAPLLIDAMVRRFAAHFTGDELKELTAFYLSPVGKRLVAEQPGMAAEENEFQQGALKGIITAKLGEVVPQIFALLAPLMCQAGMAVPTMPAPPILPQPGASPL